MTDPAIDGPFPKIHPREKIVEKAKREITTAIAAACRDLTEAETLRVMAIVLSDEVGGIAKYTIRSERHGSDSDKPGGWE